MTLSTVVLLQHAVKAAEKQRRRPLHVVGMVRRQETVDVCNYIVGAHCAPYVLRCQSVALCRCRLHLPCHESMYEETCTNQCAAVAHAFTLP